MPHTNYKMPYKTDKEMVKEPVKKKNVGKKPTVEKTDLASQCHKAAEMWSNKNAYASSKVAANSSKKAIFVCPDCGQEFRAPIYSVVKSVSHGNTGCPVCSGRKVVPGINDLATQYPKVSAMWSDKNDYAPNEIPSYSSRRAIFVCPVCKQEFVTSIRAMTRAVALDATTAKCEESMPFPSQSGSTHVLCWHLPVKTELPTLSLMFETS